MHNFVPQGISRKFVGWIALNKEASCRMNSTRPGLEFAEALKLVPFVRVFENIDVGFGVAGRRFAFQLFGHNAVMELRFYRNRCDYIAMNEMIDEMVGFAVFPFSGMDSECFFAERVRVALAELRELHFGQTPGAISEISLCSRQV